MSTNFAVRSDLTILMVLCLSIKINIFEFISQLLQVTKKENWLCLWFKTSSKWLHQQLTYHSNNHLWFKASILFYFFLLSWLFISVVYHNYQHIIFVPREFSKSILYTHCLRDLPYDILKHARVCILFLNLNLNLRRTRNGVKLSV